jgi:hypothetical protein
MRGCAATTVLMRGRGRAARVVGATPGLDAAVDIILLVSLLLYSSLFFSLLPYLPLMCPHSGTLGR